MAVTKLPWLFCHGPIKLVICLEILTDLSDFHDYFVMAPLKPAGGLFLTIVGATLPWLFCHGPIEAHRLCTPTFQLQELPWLFCHGPIEAPLLFPWRIANTTTSMTILSWPHWSEVAVCTLTVSKGTSMTILSWPHWSYWIRAKIINRWSTSMTILSWPHWSLFCGSCSEDKSSNFHDYFVMAPLKQNVVNQ